MQREAARSQNPRRVNAHATLRRDSQLFKLITGGHRDTQDINAFGFFDVADETVLVLELIVAQRRRFGSAGFDGRANKMRTVMAQRMGDGLFSSATIVVASFLLTLERGFD